MATVTKGRTFVSGETVTPAKLNELVDSATVTAIQTADIADGQITNAKVSASAAIDLSKLATGALPTSITVATANILDANVTPTKLSQPYTLATAQNSTSGTSIDFTGIPSWAKRITVMFDGVSLSAASFIRVQIGGGSVATSGYSSIGVKTNSSATAQESSTSGFVIRNGSGTSYVTRGHMVLTLVGSNAWVSSHAGTTSDGSDNCAITGGGSVTLSGALDRVRITCTGTDTFDAGTINIAYEG